MAQLFDMHCHYDFAGNATVLANMPIVSGAFSATVTPAGYQAAKEQLADAGKVTVGLGMHPWWVAKDEVGSEDYDLFDQLAAEEKYIAEVGLDFSSKFRNSESRQIYAFYRVLEACEEGGKVFSIHSKDAEKKVLDMLEEFDMTSDCTCIMHWYAGSFGQLQRAIEMGCMFSVGPGMLASGRGREYVKVIPSKQLLLETDLPSKPVHQIAPFIYTAQLNKVITELSEIRGEAVMDIVEQNSRSVLGLVEE